MFRYIPKSERKDCNKASEYSSSLLKSESNRYVNNLSQDYNKLLNDGIVYFPNYYCIRDDYSLFDKIKEEIMKEDPIRWSKHMKYENPSFSKTFNELVERMSKDFSIDIIQTRLNYYRDHSDFKPHHHDSHAYGDKEENFTLGLSLGCSREIEFKYSPIDSEVYDKSVFRFPQNNGDIFGFNKEVNRKFSHCIPKSSKECGERLSIIVWGMKK